MPHTEKLLAPPAWVEPFSEWYRHWAVAVVLGISALVAFGFVLQGQPLLIALVAIVLLPGTVLNAWLGYQGRRLAKADLSVLEGRVVDDRLELGGLVSPMARQKWASFGPGVLTLAEVGHTKQGAVLYSLSQGDAEVRFLHDSDVDAQRLDGLMSFSRSHGVHVVVEG